MFLGTYYHSLESHRRITLPKVFRDQATEWVISRGFDGGLLLQPQAQFETELHRITNRSLTDKDTRDITRLLANEAVMVNPDSAGRIQLPEYLTTFANLHDICVIIGSLNYVEIWDRDLYHEYIQNLEPQSEQIAERLAHDQSIKS